MPHQHIQAGSQTNIKQILTNNHWTLPIEGREGGEGGEEKWGGLNLSV